MLFVISDRDGRRGSKPSAPTIACVAAICFLAASPLMVSVSLTLWGG
jgi:hypothetical protein